MRYHPRLALGGLFCQHPGFQCLYRRGLCCNILLLYHPVPSPDKPQTSLLDRGSDQFIAIAAVLFNELQEVNFSFWLGMALIVVSVLIQTYRVRKA